MFRKKELRLFLISVLVLTLIFAFDDGRDVFNLRLWLANFFVILIFVLIAYFAHVYVQKLYASSIKCDSNYELWNIKRVWLGGKSSIRNKVPFGAVLGILLAFASKGTFFFTGIGYVQLKTSVQRLGRKYKFVMNFEVAKCALIGIVANLVLVIILNLVTKAGYYDFTTFMNINLWIIMFNMIPVPPLAGGQMFFGSRTLYVFGVAFLLLGYLLKSIGLLGSLGISAVLAFVIMGVYYYKWEY